MMLQIYFKEECNKKNKGKYKRKKYFVYVWYRIAY